jgi:hypothetical protein
MAMYQGNVERYDISIESPNIFTNYKSVIHLDGAFGLAFLYFVPDGENLGTNQKRANENVFDIYYHMYSWPHFTELLRRPKVHFFYDDVSNTAEIRSDPIAPGPV